MSRARARLNLGARDLEPPVVGRGIDIQVVLFYLFAVCLPDDVLTAHPLLLELVRLVERIVPTIQEYESRSSFPQVAALVLAVGWCLAPINFAYVMYWMWIGREYRRGKVLWGTPTDYIDEDGKPARLSSAISLPAGAFLALLCWFMFYINPGVDLFNANDHQAIFAFLGQVVSSFSGLFMGIAAVLLFDGVAWIARMVWEMFSVALGAESGIAWQVEKERDERAAGVIEEVRFHDRPK